MSAMNRNSSLATPHDEQPASEWASTTLSALDPAMNVSPPLDAHSAPESPGVNMPGSFPIPKQGLMPDVQGVASDALKTAKQYAQTAAHGAQNTVQSAGEKVGEYLPLNVASYLSSEPGGTQPKPSDDSTKTLPSQETSQNHPPSTSGGVGTLPGPPGEIGVAILPEERASGIPVDPSTDLKTSPIMTTTNNNPIHRCHSDPFERHTGYIPGSLQDDTSLAKLPEERRLEGLPSHDDEGGGRLGKSGGVGALPGLANESGVALLPDERKEMQASTGGAGGGASTDASIRTLHGSTYAPSPLCEVHSVPQTTGREYPLARDEEKVFGVNVKKDLDVPGTDDTAKRDNKTIPTGSNEGQDTHAVGAGSGGLAGAGTANQIASEIAAVPKKSGFIHKVKGEMKILAGKMSHNENKIEEGRKLMGKN